MITISTTTFIEPARSHILSIRETVFCREQGVDPSLEVDGLDEYCIHVLAFLDSIPIATGRIQKDGHIGRIAVLIDHRKTGVGSRVVLCLIEQARALGLERVFLASQVDAVPFYRTLGFTQTGPVYAEADIDHIDMEMKI